MRRRVTPWPKSRFSLFNWKRVKRGNEFIVLMLDSWNGDSFLNYAKQKVIIKAIHANQRFETDDVTKLVSFPFFSSWRMESHKVSIYRFMLFYIIQLSRSLLCLAFMLRWIWRSKVKRRENIALSNARHIAIFGIPWYQARTLCQWNAKQINEEWPECQQKLLWQSNCVVRWWMVFEAENFQIAKSRE